MSYAIADLLARLRLPLFFLSFGRSTEIGRMTEQYDRCQAPPGATGQVLTGFGRMMRTMTDSIVAFDTALGVCAVRWTGQGIAGVRLPSARTEGLPRLEDGVPVPDDVRAAIDGIAAVLAGGRRDLRSVVLDEAGIEPFRHAVYAATRMIPIGTTATYGQIARQIGRVDPEAARDVGAALARNPFPIVVPCHRVVGANGKLTGFSAPGGLDTKRRLLELEGAPGFGQQVLFG
jgi:methylated-DNA-[protein]-cysteine S-methyltransferase